MRRLSPLSTPSVTPDGGKRKTGREPSSVVMLPALRRGNGSGSRDLPKRPSTLTKLAPLPPSTPLRVLDFDIETVAAGFADPQWVPNRTICWAYCWVGEKEAKVSALPVADFYNHEARAAFLRPLFDIIAEADVLTGHNIVRFDLPVLNAECMLLGLPTIGAKLVQDTIKLPKSKGFKKGQDNMSHALGVKEEKLPLSWAQWEAAYAEPDLATVKERCASDVLMHIQMREKMRQVGLLGPPRMWRG